MFLKKQVLLFFSVFLGVSVYAQHEKDYWIFGREINSSGIQTPMVMDFSNSNSNPSTGTFANSANLNPPSDFTSDVVLGFEGTAVVTHPITGELLFYTDGNKVFNGNHTDVTPNGGLEGNESGSQPVAVSWDPNCSSNEYYIFSNATSNSDDLGTITYRKYNYVTETFSSQSFNLPFDSGESSPVSFSEGMIVIPSTDNPFVFWLIAHPTFTNEYRVYQISEQGIANPQIYNLGDYSSGIGSFAYSQNSIRDAEKGELAICHYKSGVLPSQSEQVNGQVLLTLFDNVTGEISTDFSDVIKVHEEFNLNNDLIEYGVEFSPSGQFLYSSFSFWGVNNQSGIYQYNIQNQTSTHLTTTSNRDKFGGLKLGPDNKIYFIDWDGSTTNPEKATVGRISTPNVSASSTSFVVENDFYIKNNVIGLNFPSFVTSPIWEASISIQGEESICAGESTTLISEINTNGAQIEYYEWYLNGEPVGNSNLEVLEVSVPGVYNLVVHVENGCSFSSEALEVMESNSCCFIAQDLADFEYNNETDNTITQNTVWNGKVYIADNVILKVQNQAILDITNVDVVFGECAGIDFTDGAILRANNSVFRPCNLDGVWKGLTFYSDNINSISPTGIINESTFKNATNAVKAGSNMNEIDIRFTNNLFSNCKAGIFLTNSVFTRGITGNTFLTDDLRPSFEEFSCNENVFEISTGIRAENIEFKEAISQNDFLAPDYTILNHTGINFINCVSPRITSNNFSDMYRSILLIGGNNSIIDQNEINLNSDFNGFMHQITLDKCNLTTIENNSILTSVKPSSEWASNNSAIYSNRGLNSRLKGNYLYGFETGIQIKNENNTVITENEIESCRYYGIYTERVRRVEVNCNVINMNVQASNDNTIGIACFGPRKRNVISSNCVFESSTAIHLEAQNLVRDRLPRISNNFLYNYSTSGIQIIGLGGSIGSGSNASNGGGQNTFVSNNGNGVVGDIVSNTEVISMGNFGVSFVTSNVSINGNNSSSTSSCGGQVNLSVSDISSTKICDNLNRPIIQIGNGNLGLNSNFKSTIREFDFDDFMIVLNYYESQGDIESVDKIMLEIVNNELLDEVERLVLKFEIAKLRKEYSSANSILVEIDYLLESENDYFTIETALMQLKETGQMSQDIVGKLNEIRVQNSDYSFFAEALLYDEGFTDKRKYFPTKKANNISNSDLVQIQENSLYIFPNPTNGILNVDYSSMNIDSELTNLVITDVSGNVVFNKSLDYQKSLEPIDVSYLSQGVYLINLFSEDKFVVSNVKFVKQ